MNKIFIGVGVVAIVLVGGYFLTQNNETSNSTSSSQAQTQQATPTSTETDTADNAEEAAQQTEVAVTEPAEAAVRNGQYIDYSETAVAEASGTKLLFFHADWCPQCRKLEDDIKANGVASGVTVFEVDYDSNQSLRQKYGVTSQTTVVRIDDSGNKVDLFLAYSTPSIAAVEAALL